MLKTISFFRLSHFGISFLTLLYNAISIAIMIPNMAKATPKVKLYSEAGYKDEIIICIMIPTPATMSMIKIFLFTRIKFCKIV